MTWGAYNVRQGPWLGLLMLSVVMTLTLLNRLDREFTSHVRISSEHYFSEHRQNYRHINERTLAKDISGRALISKKKRSTLHFTRVTAEAVNLTLSNASNDVNLALSNANNDVNLMLSNANNDVNLTLSNANNDVNLMLSKANKEVHLTLSNINNDVNLTLSNANNEVNLTLSNTNNDTNTTLVVANNDVNMTRPHVNNTVNFTAVVLLTYMRSGSSLTGDIMERHGDVFYVFEPLRALFDMRIRKKTLTFMNGTTRKYTKYSVAAVSQQVLTGWLTCDFALINKESFMYNAAFFYFGQKTKQFNRCVASVNRTEFYNNWNMQSKCMLFLKQLCMTSKFRIIKTIRTPMKMMSPVLASIPGSKVVHLIRDPRATVLSQKRRRKCPALTGGVVKCGKHLCSRIISDTNQRDRLQQTFARRFLTVQYENIVKFPSETTKTLYTFLGMNYTKSVDKYIRKLTLGEKPKGCMICQQQWQLKRQKPSDRIDAWKTSLSTGEKRSIQKWCKPVINVYNYTMHKSP